MLTAPQVLLHRVGGLFKVLHGCMALPPASLEKTARGAGCQSGQSSLLWPDVIFISCSCLVILIIIETVSPYSCNSLT